MVRAKRQPTTLTGKVCIDSYDIDGSILSIKITSSAGEYLIADTKCGQQLLKNIDATIVCRGDLVEEGGLIVFEPTDFQILS